MLGLPVGPGPMSFPLKPFLLLSDETGKVIATKFFDMYEGGKKTCPIKIKTKLCRPHREREIESGFFLGGGAVFIDCRFCCISEHHAPGHQFLSLIAEVVAGCLQKLGLVAGLANYSFSV